VAPPAAAAAAAIPEPKTPSLTPRERHAFLELSRRLSEGLNGLAGAAAAQGRPDAPDTPPAPRQSGGAHPKTDVLAKLSHGIRTQLNAISGFSEVMMDGQFGPVGNERYRLYLMDIQTSASQLIALMNDLFTLSDITSGEIDLSFKGVALNDVTLACLDLVQQRAKRERIIVRSALAHRLPQVVADAPSVQQMVLNLLGNSIRSAGAGGQAIVTTALSDDGDVVLRVRDTGTAMSAKDITMALEPLRQLAVSTRFGNGLELALTKALAEANHASFHITSQRDAGTLIEVTFPAAQVLAR
jgi:signal transduction histidine kinase